MIVVTGASGFIGQHLMRKLADGGYGPVRSLVRKPEGAIRGAGIELVEGDILSKDAWRALVAPGCTVINLAQANEWTSFEAASAMQRAAEVCGEVGIKRFVHCSTAAVYGRAESTRLREDDHCSPTNEYGRVKFAIEETLTDRAAGRFQLANVRPTSVFGEGGGALESLVRQLTQGNAAVNYARSCLFGERAMHLVPVKTVVASMLFLSTRESQNAVETFIVSDDHEPNNTFRAVERMLIEVLHLSGYPVAPVNLPPWVIEGLLRLKGRSNTNTRRIFDGSKLRAAGFAHPISFDVALRNFAQSRFARLEAAGMSH